jgi:hypothetical protein
VISTKTYLGRAVREKGCGWKAGARVGGEVKGVEEGGGGEGGGKGEGGDGGEGAERPRSRT